MTKFIPLTYVNWNTLREDGTIWVNPDKIIWMKRDETKGLTQLMMEGYTPSVKEEPSLIQTLVRGSVK